ncbi:MAG: methyltransferase domain-containing protein [Candidatus Dormibacteria bacterium]
MSRRRPSDLGDWPVPFDPHTELDWGDPVVSRRLLREHLDQGHDGASRRERTVDQHVRRLRRLLPEPPARILDAACGPGLYAVRLAALGYAVDGVDVGPAVLEHARRLARRRGVSGRTTFAGADLRDIAVGGDHDAVLLIYFVLEGFPRVTQVAVLRRLRRALRPGGRLIAELRLRPEHPVGRVSSWDVVETSLLSDRPHLLLTDTMYDERRNTYVLRETAIFDNGRTAQQQTTSRLMRLDDLESLFARAGLRVRSVRDGWTRYPANALCDSVLVVAERVSETAGG